MDRLLCVVINRLLIDSIDMAQLIESLYNY
jgi:hypothetical protein